MIKKLIGGILLLVFIILVLGFIIPKKMKVSESIHTQAPTEDVYNFVRSLQSLTEQTVWQEIDPNVKKSFRGTDGTVGSVYRWESDHKKVGIGEQEVVELIDGERVVHELRFYEPWESTDKATMFTRVSGEGTELRWAYESDKIPYPMHVFVTPFVTPQLKNDFRESLENIKQAIE